MNGLTLVDWVDCKLLYSVKVYILKKYYLCNP